MDQRSLKKGGGSSSNTRLILRSLKYAFVALGLLIVGIAVASWVAGDVSTLPFDYDGFD